MLRLRPTLLALPFVLALSASANADTTLIANITNGQENPPVVPTLVTGAPRPASYGSALFLLNDSMTALSFTATIYNLDFTGTQTADINDNLRAAHIHAGPNVDHHTNGGVVWGFFGNPFNDNNPNDIVVTPFASGVGGTISGKWDAPEGNNTTLTDQLSNLLNERAYINFHTVQFGGGEIRGAIVAVPEPGAVALFAGLGVSGLLALRRRRRR